MKETRYFYVPDAARQSELPEEEAGHALRVLRLKAGDEMFLMDGVGTFFRAEVTVAAGKHCMYEIKDRFPQHPTWRGHIHLAIAPTKMMERMEWMVEKATEVGFDEISFFDKNRLDTFRPQKSQIHLPSGKDCCLSHKAESQGMETCCQHDVFLWRIYGR